MWRSEKFVVHVLSAHLSAVRGARAVGPSKCSDKVANVVPKKCRVLPWHIKVQHGIGTAKCSDQQSMAQPKKAKSGHQSRDGRVKVDGVAPESGTQPSGWSYES